MNVLCTCAAAAIAASSACSLGASAAIDPPLGIRATPIDDQVRRTLGLRAFVLAFGQPMLSQDGIPGRMTFEIDLGNGPTKLVLDPYSVRTADFTVVVAGDGEPVVARPPPITTFRGVDSSTGSPVAASIQDGRLSAAVRPEHGEAVFIQPLTDAGIKAENNQYVIYRQSDVRGGSWRCGGGPECLDCGSAISARGPGTGCVRAVEVLFDTDFPFFQRHTSAATTVSDVENIVNQCDLIYRRDVGISWTIRQVTVRTSADTDPYNDLPTASVDPNTILNRVGTVWSGVATPTRDLVHLMTGRDLASSTIGIAWVGVVCRSSSNTGVSQSLFTNNLAMRTNVTAHEIGHNFGASHDSSGNLIMAPAVSPSSVLQFSAASISAITGYISGSGTCLTNPGPTTGSDSAATQAPQPVLIDVLANDASPCGNTLTLSLQSSSTTRGGSVSISVGTGPSGRNQVRYTPPATVPSGGLADTFTYRVTESSTNANATGTVGVTVTTVVIPPNCVGDFNDSGAVSVQDLFDFLGAYFAGDTNANINNTGGITVQDLFEFLTAYFTPCP